MTVIGLIKEGKIPSDNRVALTPAQCKWLKINLPNVKILVESSATRCFSDAEYKQAGIEVTNDLTSCDILLGIKEVPVDMLIANKTYLFFSHTKKQQPHNRKLIKAIIEKNITLIDYECLEHDDGQRIIGFGFFAGIVGAHNGIMAFGNRTGLFQLPRVYQCKDYRSLIHHYFGLKLPNIKIAVTGSGRVAHGIIEVMNLMGVHEVEADEYLEKKFSYPVYVQLKGADLYTHQENKTYKREHFHQNPTEYRSRFLPYTKCTDILMNGVYWDENIPRLFELTDVNERFVTTTIADITDDEHGSVPLNLGDQTIENPVYGVDKKTFLKTEPYLPSSIDIVAVGNLPNELPRDASRYFGEQLLKYILGDILNGASDIITRATIINQGKLTKEFSYLENYVK
ncbi:MAG TPA: NAD(P)-dependent oxidoreductase [Chitinophagaceae bacterium]|nr:NAD(P)-dependent oxidoreductase [Chitinophagaceae bacterium]HMZ47081.1 NAD(P)-dependent oxidoreductase [Chitinophagaceae bacterium]